jgi:putative NIF3 family GTP cyclohydrolase 1 type 2
LATPSQVQSCIVGVFDADKLEQCRDEWGFTWVAEGPVLRIGYATNLTPEVAEEAVRQEVELVLTHHDAWPFLYGMAERCAALLHPQGISHCFFHAPLDDAGFGNNTALAERLGLRVTAKCALYRDTFFCGRIGELEQPVDFGAMLARLEEALGETVRAWRHSERPVQRAYVATGGGHTTDLLKEAVDRGCDTYITGEKMLYTVEYARFAGLNLLVGSHTGTELLGTEALARKVAEGCGIEAVRLPEPHIE